jgi:Pectate lyase superfamily protein
VSVKDFGAVGDGVTDDWNAFKLAHDSFGAVNKGGTIVIPAGVYYLSQTWDISRPLNIIGAGTSQFLTTSGTMLEFAPNIDGIRVWSSGQTPASPDGGSAAKTSISHMFLKARPTTTSGCGIHASTQVFITEVCAENFGSHGFRIEADSVGGSGNANQWSVRDCRANNCKGSGLYVAGADANAGNAFGFDGSNNLGWGIYDFSFLGNTYVGCHCNNNGTGSYKVRGTVNQTLLLGCYVEGAGVGRGTEFDVSAMIIGGTLAGAATYPILTISGDGSGATAVARSNGSVLTVTVTDPGSGYTTATCTAAAGGSGSGATFTPVISGGKIASITVNAGGSGYPAQSPRGQAWFREDPQNGGFITSRIESRSLDLQAVPTKTILNNGFDSALSFVAPLANTIDLRYNSQAGSWDFVPNKSTSLSSLRFKTSLSTTELCGRGSVADVPQASVLFPNGFWIGGSANGRYVFNGVAAPASGAYARGDVIWNRDMSAGSNLGWVCITGGTPGTWAKFGGIESANAYTATNVTTDRTFDADTVAVAELADIVGTLIADLKASGILK